MSGAGPGSAETGRAPPVVVRTLRSLAELAAVRPDWVAFQHHPWSDFDYVTRFLARKAGYLRPHVLVLERAGRVAGLLVASLRDEHIPWRIGNRALFGTRACVLRVSTGGALGEATEDCARAAMEALLAALAGGEADALYLHQIAAGHPLERAARELPDFLARDRFARRSSGWELDVPGSYAEYKRSRSKSVRSNLNYYANRIQRELGPGLRLACYRREDELETLVRDTEAVARLTYHRRMGLGFADTPGTRELCAYALAAGWLRAYVLYSGPRPIAFWHGLAYGASFYTRDTGFDPEFGELRPGNYLLARIVEEHCGGAEVRRIDFGVMDAEYKRNFGTRPYEVASVYAFSRRPRGCLLASLRAASGATERLARAVLGAARGRRLARRMPGAARDGAAGAASG